MKKEKWFPYVLVSPAMVGIFVFTLYPMIYLVYLSFFNWNLLKTKQPFVGVDNYIQLFSREDFLVTLLNTCVYTFFVVFFLLVLALLLALWFNKTSKLDHFGQIAIFTPHIISMVSVALVWMWIMDPELGFLNYILKFIGIPPSKWLQSSKTAMLSIVIVSIWKSVGYYTLIILAALQGISPSIYEAAALDNASRIKTFFKITLPLISPQLFFLLIVMTISSFKVFETINIMTGGGPNDSTNVLVYYIWEYAFVHMKIGYASAAGVVLMVIVAIVTFIYFKLLSKKVFYQ